MSDCFSPDAPQLLLDDLCRLVADRRETDERLRGELAASQEAAEKLYKDSRQSAAERHETEKEECEREYAAVREETEKKYQTEHDALSAEYESARTEIETRHIADTQAAQQKQQDSHWEAIESSDAARGGLNVPLQELAEGLDSRWSQLAEFHRQAAEIMQRRGFWEDLPAPEPTNVMLEKHPGRRFCTAVDKAQAQFRVLEDQRLPNWFQGLRQLWIFILLWILISIPVIFWLGPLNVLWAPLSCVVAAVIGGSFRFWLYRLAKRRSADAYLALRRTMLEAGLGNQAVLENAKADCKKLDKAIIAQHKEQAEQAEKEFAGAIARINQRRDDELRQVEETYPKKLADLAAWRDGTIRQIEDKYPALLRQIEEEYKAETERQETERERSLRDSQDRHDRLWREMSDLWSEGLERFRRSLEEGERESRGPFPDWNADEWQQWTPPGEIPPSIPLGHATVKLENIEGGVPDDERLRPERVEFAMPFALPFPRKSLLLLKADGAGRLEAVDLMQSAMLRMLTALPPSKVRFTIIDPVGLGENFSGFMHLADFDEQLVASRIWTDSAHIEQRLADLTKHMEDVIQVYLRKEFQSIEEYNAFAGEMAEPYRVLVVANFPANFSEVATQRLKSIAASGARCGVFVLLSVDTKSPLPRNFHLADLESESLALDWNGEHFTWSHSDYGPLALDYPRPPSVDRFKEIVFKVGGAARDSGRVEVPFTHIIPEEKNWWTAEGRAGVDVPLGRAGAMKLQHLSLGSGTSQHVLISGKTGSGKSTLLHVLITNLALRYSPDEIELYLIDFKKGVEFKAYSRFALPHARVIAIESEREFGLSVLQRLDERASKTRGDMFRRRGRAGPGRVSARAQPEVRNAANSPDYRRVSGVVRRGRPHRPGMPTLLSGPARSARPCVWNPRAVGFANARPGLIRFARSDDRSDGCSHRPAMQRI